MCIAVVTWDEWGAGACPTHDDLRSMDRQNPHGAGLAWPDDRAGALVYMKGLRLDDAEYLLRHVPRPTLLHFRWATHGGRSDSLTHPFPLGPAAVVSDATEGLADRVLIHNGTWSDYGDHLPPWLGEIRSAAGKKSCQGVSDTAVAAYKAGADLSILPNVKWCVAVMGYRPDADGDKVKVWGKWEHPKGTGTYFSNMNWKTRGWKR